MSMFDKYRCPACGHEVADIDMATTLDMDVCPKCKKAPISVFVFVAAKVTTASNSKRMGEHCTGENCTACANVCGAHLESIR